MISVFSDYDLLCAECGAAMCRVTKTLSEVDNPYQEFWCITDDCSQKDKSLKIEATRYVELSDLPNYG